MEANSPKPPCKVLRVHDPEDHCYVFRISRAAFDEAKLKWPGPKHAVFNSQSTSKDAGEIAKSVVMMLEAVLGTEMD